MCLPLDRGFANYENTIIIAPQFLINGDNCWDQYGKHHLINLSSTPPVDCDLPVWKDASSWISGDFNVNLVNRNHIYSYDVINMLIDRLVSKKHFANMQQITLFGFSAGAQLVQRYGLHPVFTDLSTKHMVRYIIADASSYSYYNAERPYTNGEEKFGIPDSIWLPPQWSFVHGSNTRWIEGFDKSCMSYNIWRNGIENPTGYIGK